MADAYLHLDKVVKSYDGKSNAVDGISIRIERGEFVSFLGPSGSGKTTSLMMIAGFEEPTSGRITLGGEDLTHTKPYHRNIGMVFQNYALFPHMTVARNVAFPLRMRWRPRAEIERRVAEALELVGLTAFAQRHPRELSGGQQQRVAVARGLVFRPDVLLLDEPLGALDKNLREQMQIEIKRIHREVGITMVYVTHDQTEAMTMSDRIAVFNRGRIEQLDSPLTVYDAPANRFVGQFIGDSNLFSGRVRDAAAGDIDVEGLGAVRTSRSLPSSALRNDTPVDVLIRPERLQMQPGGAEGAGAPSVVMQVDSIVNYGDSLVAVGSGNGVPLRVRLNSSRHAGLREGARIGVAWSPQDVHVMPVD